MKYRVTQPFIAFGKVAEPGQVVELMPEQAIALNESDCIAEYEMKVQAPPENKAAKKSSAVSRRGQAAPKKTRSKSVKSQTK